MKKAFADPTVELVLFGFDVITSSGGGIVSETKGGTDTEGGDFEDLSDSNP